MCTSVSLSLPLSARNQHHLFKYCFAIICSLPSESLLDRDWYPLTDTLCLLLNLFFSCVLLHLTRVACMSTGGGFMERGQLTLSFQASPSCLYSDVPRGILPTRGQEFSHQTLWPSYTPR